VTARDVEAVTSPVIYRQICKERFLHHQLRNGVAVSFYSSDQNPAIPAV